MKAEPIFTNEWACGNYPLWMKFLGRFIGKETHALEIGSCEGRSSCFFVQNILTHPDSRLTCVDPWVMPGTEERFHHNIDVLGCRSKMNIIKAFSDDTALDATKWDFVYVDGWHSAQATLFDAVRSWVSLKKGGIMVFDDYQWCLNTKPRADCPKMGIDAFLNICERELKVLHMNMQVIVEKL